MTFPGCQRLLPKLLLLLVLGSAGCIPTRDSSKDEQREPLFLRGQELRNQLDHRGAAEAFERALEANPRSASAHFELGLLFEQHLNDPAAAIYHFEHFLKLRPTSDRAEIVRQRVGNCKMELAKLFLIAPNAPSVQKELDKLKAEVEKLGLENNQLRRQFEVAVAQATARGVVLTSLPPTLSAASPPAPKANSGANVVETAPKPSAPKPVDNASKPAKTSPLPASPPSATSPTAASRTHTVKSGDIPATIAKQYGVKLEALMAANPNLDPKRMKVGQTVTIPAP